MNILITQTAVCLDGMGWMGNGKDLERNDKFDTNIKSEMPWQESIV